MGTLNEAPKYKVILVGEASVGKTSILRQFTENKFDLDIMNTIGIDFSFRELVVTNKKNEKKTINLQIWDTAGQERFHSITKSYYRGSDAIVLVFSLLDPRSFECIDRWLKNINEECDTIEDRNITLVIAANKCDAQERLPKSTVSEKIAKINDTRTKNQKNRIKLFITSAKSGYNINELFDYIGKELVDRKAKSNRSKKSIIVDKIRSRGCC